MQPLYLALDTSTEPLSLALYTPERVYVHSEHVGQRHAELTLPAIAQLLEQAQVERSQLAGIVYGMGPGSFTGLRIACGIAQGLAFALNIPLLGISTLEAAAWQCSGELAYVCLDARMNQVYCAAYQRRGDTWQAVIAATVCNPEEVPLPPAGEWIGVGSGFAAYADALQLRLGAQLVATQAQVLPHAREMLQLAVPRFIAGEAWPAAQAQLLYLRDKVALKTHERIKPT